MASFSKYYLPMCAANNNATFVSRDKDGKYVDAITSKEFKDAMNWGVDLIKKGYIKPKPSEDVAWDWYKAAFRDGEAAMQTAEVYEISAFADMEDDWGFVMFPYNQDQKDATNKTVPNDNIVVMPSCFDQEKLRRLHLLTICTQSLLKDILLMIRFLSSITHSSEMTVQQMKQSV